MKAIVAVAVAGAMGWQNGRGVARARRLAARPSASRRQVVVELYDATVWLLLGAATLVALAVTS